MRARGEGGGEGEGESREKVCMYIEELSIAQGNASASCDAR